MNEGNPKKGTSNWADVSALVFFFSGILLFLFFSGTLNSGYHFTDDHEMIRINSDLQTSSVINTSAKWIKSDLNIRFRPMYFVHRVMEMKVFGTDFFTLSFYTAILAAFTFSFFYLGIRKLKYSVTESVLFVLLVFTGSQMAIWWMLGPNETIGMFFLGLAFLFMAKSTEKKKYFQNTILFGIFMIFTSLCKESFVIIVPAFIFYKIWNEKNIFGINLRKSIRNNWLLLFPAGIMVFELWVIFFIVGTNTIGYAGSTSSAGELVSGIWAIFTKKNMLLDWVKLIAFIVLLYFLSFLFSSSGRLNGLKKSIRKILAPVLFSFLIIAPNIILYAKSGMFERYLLPATVGLAFLVASMMRDTDNFFFQKIVIIAIALFVIISCKTALIDASIFAERGRQTGELLSAIVKNYNAKKNILLAAEPADRFEASFSLKTYLSSKGINNLYGYPMEREYKSDFERGLAQGWEQWFEGKNIIDMPSQPEMIVFLDKSQLEKFFEENDFPESKYKNIIDSSNPQAVYLLK